MIQSNTFSFCCILTYRAIQKKLPPFEAISRILFCDVASLFWRKDVCLLEGCVQIESVTGLHGIGGELVVPCTTNRLYGGPNAFGRRKRPFGFHTRTLMSRPHMTRVPRTVPGGEQQLDNRGNRSGRERSSPTWGHECCGVTGWRKCVGLARRNERPP